MRRFAFALMIVALTLALLPGAAFAHTCDAPAAYPLYAGQTMLVGYVYVCNDGDSLTVTYDTTSSGWPISETHLAVGDELSDIPQKNGNPPPGQFPYKGDHNPAVTTVSYTIPYSAAIGDVVYIAAHAVVWDTGSQALKQVCSDGDGSEPYTAYNNPVLGPDNSATVPPFAYAYAGSTSVDGRTGFARPSSEPYGEQTDAQASAWDEGVGAPFYNTDGGANLCADWIWEDNFDAGFPGLNQPVNPWYGDLMTVTDSFDLPGPFASGTLYASCDNAYEAYVNTTTPGAPLISGQTGSTVTYPDWWTSDLKEGNVNANGWQSVESAPLAGLVQGPNYLYFRAANEFMQGAAIPPGGPPLDTGGNGFPGFYPIGAISTGYQFVPQAYFNPAGIIWQADIYYYDSDETAWGAGNLECGPDCPPGTNPFPGKNWATYITYEWQ